MFLKRKVKNLIAVVASIYVASIFLNPASFLEITKDNNSVAAASFGNYGREFYVVFPSSAYGCSALGGLGTIFTLGMANVPSGCKDPAQRIIVQSTSSFDAGETGRYELYYPGDNDGGGWLNPFGKNEFVWSKKNTGLTQESIEKYSANIHNFLPDNKSGQVMGSNAVHIISEVPMSVSMANNNAFTPAMFTAIPVEKLGKNYILSSSANMVDGGRSEFIIVGTVASTRVKITYGKHSSKSGQTKTITLGASDTYGEILNNTMGTTIDVESGGNIAVITADQNNYQAWWSQVPPISSLGNKYVATVNSGGNSTGVVIVATQDGTKTSKGNLSKKGDYIRYSFSEIQSTITSDYPILVYQFEKSVNNANISSTFLAPIDANSNDNRADVFMFDPDRSAMAVGYDYKYTVAIVVKENSDNNLELGMRELYRDGKLASIASEKKINASNTTRTCDSFIDGSNVCVLYLWNFDFQSGKRYRIYPLSTSDYIHQVSVSSDNSLLNYFIYSASAVYSITPPENLSCFVSPQNSLDPNLSISSVDKEDDIIAYKYGINTPGVYNYSIASNFASGETARTAVNLSPYGYGVLSTIWVQATDSSGLSATTTCAVTPIPDFDFSLAADPNSSTIYQNTVVPVAVKAALVNLSSPSEKINFATGDIKVFKSTDDISKATPLSNSVHGMTFGYDAGATDSCTPYANSGCSVKLKVTTTNKTGNFKVVIPGKSVSNKEKKADSSFNITITPQSAIKAYSNIEIPASVALRIEKSTTPPATPSYNVTIAKGGGTWTENNPVTGISYRIRYTDSSGSTRSDCPTFDDYLASPPTNASGNTAYVQSLSLGATITFNCSYTPKTDSVTVYSNKGMASNFYLSGPANYTSYKVSGDNGSVAINNAPVSKTKKYTLICSELSGYSVSTEYRSSFDTPSLPTGTFTNGNSGTLYYDTDSNSSHLEFKCLYSLKKGTIKVSANKATGFILYNETGKTNIASGTIDADNGIKEYVYTPSQNGDKIKLTCDTKAGYDIPQYIYNPSDQILKPGASLDIGCSYTANAKPQDLAVFASPTRNNLAVGVKSSYVDNSGQSTTVKRRLLLENVIDVVKNADNSVTSRVNPEKSIRIGDTINLSALASDQNSQEIAIGIYNYNWEVKKVEDNTVTYSATNKTTIWNPAEIGKYIITVTFDGLKSTIELEVLPPELKPVVP
ncbi:IgGFc-binding protein [Candidatus Microgenomates bacterium]|nr:IgGFc-binding protein [Candidatus Microgenomates bacterium]